MSEKWDMGDIKISSVDKTAPLSQVAVVANQENIDRQLIESIAENSDPQIVDGIVSVFKIDDVTDISQFGSSINDEVEGFVNNILAKVKSNGPIGEGVNKNFNELVGVINDYDVSKPKLNFLSKIPVFGYLFEQDFKSSINKFDNVKEQVDGLVGFLLNNKTVLESEVSSLNVLYNQHVTVVNSINNYIIAGTQIVESMKSELSDLKDKFERTNDLFISQKQSDLDNKLLMMQRKIDTLGKRRILAIQTAIQARIMQELAIKIIDDITDVSVEVISLWKTQFAIALNVKNMKQVNQINQNVKDMANKQYLENVNGIKELSDLVLESSRTGSIDIESLKYGNSITAGIITEMRNNHAKTRAVIEQNAKQLVDMETEIKQKLAGDIL